MAEPKNIRERLIAAVKGPWGWFTLALLVVEGILTGLAWKAKGSDFTILLVGILIILIMLIVVVAQLASLSQSNGSAKPSNQPIVAALAIILIVAFAGGSIWGGLTFFKQADKMNDLHEQIAELRVTNSVLQNENARLITFPSQLELLQQTWNNARLEISQLWDVSNNLVSENARVGHDRDSLLQEITRVRAVQSDEIEKDSSALVKLANIFQEVPQLNLVISNLTVENAYLKALTAKKVDVTDYQKLKELNDSIQTNYLALHNELDAERQKNKQLIDKFGPLQDLGIKGYYDKSYGFIQEERPLFVQSTNLIILSGFNFFITLKQYEYEILSALNRGTAVQILMLDDTIDDFQKIAADFGQDEGQVRDECKESKDAAKHIFDEWSKSATSDKAKQLLQIRLTKRSPRARCYFFDPETSHAVAFVVPYLNQIDSKDLPGFVLENSPKGLFIPYLASFRLYWEAASDWNPDAPSNLNFRASRNITPENTVTNSH